jgi:hypothetical protein
MSIDQTILARMIAGAQQELDAATSSLASVANQIAFVTENDTLYKAMMAESRTDLESQLGTKRDSLYNSYSAWQANHSYGLGDVVKPGNGYVYEITRAGSSGSDQPTWPTTVGDTVDDPDEYGAGWTCGVVEIQYGATYNVTVLSDWNIKRRISASAGTGTVLYHYLSTGWDSNAVIIEAIDYWAIIYPLVSSIPFGTTFLLSALNQGSALIEDKQDMLEARNPILSHYVV